MMRYIYAMIVVLAVCSCATPPPPAKPVSGFSKRPYNYSFIPRRSSFLTGTQIMTKSQGLPFEKREQLYLMEALKGNLPPFLTRLKRVGFTRTFGNSTYRVTIWVMPDYLALGSNDDFVRIPVTPGTAQKIADQYNCLLPNPYLVDLIYRKASKRIRPILFESSDKIVTSEMFLQHDRLIQKKLAGLKMGTHLIAGHKKDIILANGLVEKPDRVALYGLHIDEKTKIQPMSLANPKSYVDYSHGVRLISNRIQINGVYYSLREVLVHPVLSQLVSPKGPLKISRIPFTAEELAKPQF